ncbi:MAG: hypothetical protein ABIO02_03995 [Patescibacteria group bacterium]
MTRLEQHKQKIFYQKVALMVGILLVLLAFVFFIGFQVILKSSGFVGTIGSKSETDSSDVDNFFGTLNVDDLPIATNSAKLMISGSVDDFDKLEFYINDKKVDSSPADTDTFNEIIGNLTKGKNEIYVKALTNDKKHSKTSPILSITYTNEKPLLEITSPGDNAKVNKSEVKIEGKTDKGVEIKINDLPTVVDAQGSFQQAITLKEGENKIHVVAQDDAGNTEQRELTIVYERD